MGGEAGWGGDCGAGGAAGGVRTKRAGEPMMGTRFRGEGPWGWVEVGGEAAVRFRLGVGLRALVRLDGST